MVNGWKSGSVETQRCSLRPNLLHVYLQIIIFIILGLFESKAKWNIFSCHTLALLVLISEFNYSRIPSICLRILKSSELSKLWWLYSWLQYSGSWIFRVEHDELFMFGKCQGARVTMAYYLNLILWFMNRVFVSHINSRQFVLRFQSNMFSNICPIHPRPSHKTNNRRLESPACLLSCCYLPTELDGIQVWDAWKGLGTPKPCQGFFADKRQDKCMTCGLSWWS